MPQQETDHNKNGYPGSEQKVPGKRTPSLAPHIKHWVQFEPESNCQRISKKKTNFEFRNHIYSVYIFFIWTFWLKKAKTLTYFTQNCSGSVLDFHFCNQH